jgi:hypothetical protein
MKSKWSFFWAAAVFAGWALVSNGVPLLPVLTGTAAAGALQFWRSRRVSVHK